MDNSFDQESLFFDTLDRSVLFATLGGVLFNCVDQSFPGIVLTLMAAISYGLMRNRIANIDNFHGVDGIAPPPGVNLRFFTLICLWLGSRQLFDGLLGDIIDPEIGGDSLQIKRYLRNNLWLAIVMRIKETCFRLLWFNQSR